MASVLPEPDEWAALTPAPGGPVWRAFNDARMLGTAGYATLLQVAHPTVGNGVHQYSSFTKDPWGRLLRTLDYVHGTIYGGPEMAGSIGRRVRTVHKTIKGVKDDGERYSAMEPGAFAWVHATLAIGIVEGRAQFATPMSWAEQQAFWDEWLRAGRLIGVRERDLPKDWGDVQAYVDRVIDEELRWTPAVPEVLATLSQSPPPNVPGLPGPVWRVISKPIAAQQRILTTGLMPPRLRAKLRLPYTRRDRLVFAAVCRANRAMAPLLRPRSPLSAFGEHYVVWRRAALQRGEVAAAGATPERTAVAA